MAQNTAILNKFYINGEWCQPSTDLTMAVDNPATGEVIGTLARAQTADVEAAITAAQQAFTSFSQTSVEQRLTLLHAINKGLQARNDELAAAVSIEMGAPDGLAKNAQAPSGSQHFSEMIKVLENYQFEKTTAGNTLVRQEAIGVCALITPWNWPLNQIATKVAPAIAAGCSMILKPSEIAPLSAAIFTEILHDAGVPAGVFNLIHGTGSDIGNTLTSHPAVDMVSFTGSTRAGIAISHSAAPSIKRVSLELGGKSAGIVVSTDDIDKTAKQIIGSSMTNSGQSCNALTRLLVPANLKQPLAQAMVKQAEALTVDMPEKSPNLGPVASQTHYQKVKTYIEQGLEQGAELLVGGAEKPAGLEQGCFVKPTVFSNVSPEMTIANEEIFGPVLSIIEYDSLEQAIEIANDSKYGLSGYVWSKDQAQAVEIAKQLRTGMVHINGQGLDSSAPFGGFKQSGNGREWGEYGLHEFLEYKSVYCPA